MFRRPLGSL